jgi:hypothetical protein
MRSKIMYYRIAIQSQSSPAWRWVSTPLGSLNNVMQWLRFYQSLPRDRLRVFESASREDLSGQLLCENSEVSSRSILAAKFMSAGSDGPSATTRDTTNAAQNTGNCQAQAFVKSSESFLDRRRHALECGAGGDHDLPYRFSLPASMPQLLAWVNLLTRVEHGDLRTERIPVGAGTRSSAECADEASGCTRSNTAA